MAKILLVEDDVNLREIYSARFAAESYQVITASDGEEALATAVRERPDLIVLDVMMPKISGFDVLDILRSTPETKDTKVIMMTALSQDTDRQRGESLGVNKYLIKSQVTLEDVVNSVKEQLAASK
jgi:two-component system, OmpR family, response regulator RpaB